MWAMMQKLRTFFTGYRERVPELAFVVCRSRSVRAAIVASVSGHIDPLIAIRSGRYPCFFFFGGFFLAHFPLRSWIHQPVRHFFCHCSLKSAPMLGTSFLSILLAAASSV